MIEVAELQQIHAAAAGRHAELRAAAAAQVVKTAWGTGSLSSVVDPRPFLAERRGDPPERLVGKRPRGAFTEYGIDHEGRAVLARMGWDDGPVVSEWLRLEAGGVWFGPEGHSSTLDARDGEQLLAHGTYWGESWQVETYDHVGDRVVRIRVEGLHASSEAGVYREHYDLSYDDRGLAAIQLTYPHSEHRRDVWVRLDQPIGKELAELHELLVAEVGPHCEPGRALALHYDAENPLSVAVEIAPLSAIEEEWGDPDFDALYPANWELDERPLSEALRTRLEAAGGYLRVKGQPGKGRKLLYGVCRRLNERAPDEAFVFAAEVGGERLDKDLKESLLPEQLARLP